MLRFACFLLPALLLAGCGEDCPASDSVVLAGDAYCGDPCSSCAACPAGFSCQFRGTRGVCVDEEFLTSRSLTTACEDPCPSGQVRFDDMGTSLCVDTCSDNSECPDCCFEPAGIEIMICAPRVDLCM